MPGRIVTSEIPERILRVPPFDTLGTSDTRTVGSDFSPRSRADDEPQELDDCESDEDARSFITAPLGPDEYGKVNDEQFISQVQNVFSKIGSQLSQGKGSVAPEEASIPKLFDTARADPWSDFIRETTANINLGTGCDQYCRCRCHSQTPHWNWSASSLSHLLGSVRLSVTGCSFNNEKHTDPSCVNWRRKKVQLHYRLPSWVLGTTSIAFFWSNHQGSPEFLLRIRSIVGPVRDCTYELYKTIPANDVEGTKRALLSGRASIHDAIFLENGRSPLHLAITNLCFDVIKFLLLAGADLYLPDDRGIEPIASAFQLFASSGVPTARQLADLFSFDRHMEDAGYVDLHKATVGLFPLSLAEALRMPRIAAQINTCSRTGIPPIYFATKGDDVRLLYYAGAEPNMTDDNGNTALLRACFMGQKDVVAALIDCGTDINLANVIGNTPLSALCWCHPSVDDEIAVQILTMLLPKGPDLNPISKYGDMALQLAAEMRSAEFLWVYLSAGPNGMYVDPHGEGPVTGAIESRTLGGSPVKLGMILCYGAKVNLLDSRGQNTLHYAALTGSVGMMEMLEAWGPCGLDPKLRDFRGNTPRDVLAKRDDLSDGLEEAMDRLLLCMETGDSEEKTEDRVARIRNLLEGYQEFRDVRQKWPLCVQGFGNFGDSDNTGPM